MFILTKGIGIKTAKYYPDLATQGFLHLIKTLLSSDKVVAKR